MRRRTFLKGLAAGGLGLCAGPVYARAREAADLAFFGGTVVTMNPLQPAAEAVAVRQGRILAVGARQDVEAVCDGQTKRVDLTGKCLSPGLIDAHSHLIGFGQMEMFFVNLRPPKVHDFASLREVLVAEAAQRPAGQWIVARGFVNFDEGRFPRRQDIDDATPRHPVLLIHWSGQYGIANTLALKQADLLRADVRDPYGGKYLRDPKTGVPDGLLLHYPAIYAVHRPELAPDEQRRAAAFAARRFAAEGVTCVHDNFCGPRHAVSYVEAEQEGKLPLRIRVYPYAWNVDHCRKLLKLRRYDGPRVRLQGIKLAVDGYPLMYRVPAQHGHLNLPMHPQDQFETLVSLIHQAGLQVDVHAVGDRGVDLVLDAFRKASGSDRAVHARRHRIEHFPFRRAESIRRAADLGVPVCTQPLQMVVRGDEFLQRFGRDPVQTMVPAASFRRAGVQLSFGADVPAFPSHRPLDSIRCAMARQTAAGSPLDAAERISFLEALEAHTIAAAWAASDEKDLGSIETRKCADLAVWNRDLRAIRTSRDLDRLQVVATYVAGEQTHQV
jgi:predicted amidohydrolase YtcJ